MRALVALTLLAGAAAGLALFARDRLAAHVSAALAEPIAGLADAARKIAPAPVSAPVVPAPPVAAMVAAPTKTTTKATVAIVPKKIVRPDAKKASGHAAHVVSRAEVEEAIANRLSGASAKILRDPEGKAIGLALHGVSKLAPFGVMDGDVLVSANGLALRTADEAMAALGALKDATRVVVVFRRGEATFAVPIEIGAP